ncbi:CARDB domain-containing protein [Candidatus Marimicrobium litorale]|uniref:Peptidase metallopeptidase domain-containing protein n=1 Tax=Candidatus Marimicrobium litorale TaxID=2518991 RepID=A0ABT3TAG0_9GAMM|nr:CARDB domain-containing protein [Candidatus Marimicrobium litorale]MCX2978449.1 hypothetical protein [Candidatus Marimicrobium litorale]
MNTRLKVPLLLISLFALDAQAYNYITCQNGLTLDFNGGDMTFNYGDNLSADEKVALSLAFQRLTDFSDATITTVDNGDDSYFSGNDENEIYLDSAVSTATCTYWFFSSTCEVAEADMQFGNQPWTTSDDSGHYPFSGGSRSLTGTAVHEGGHCVGMAHSSDSYNMMGADFSHVTRNGTAAYYGPGEDLSDGLIDLHGKRSGGLDSFRDVGITVMRYTGASGEYSVHGFGAVRGFYGAARPVVGSYVGQPMYRVGAGASVQIEITLENNGEADTETPNIGLYLSDNDIISSSDEFLGQVPSSLGRDNALEITLGAIIPASTAPGNYFLGAYIDHDNLISETTVANNVAYYPVSIVSAAPTLITEVASGITATGATLNATINPNGELSDLVFDYGVTVDYGSSAAFGTVGSGSTAVVAGEPVTGLTCETTYYFRPRGDSVAGTVLGLEGSFVTAVCPPGCD